MFVETCRKRWTMMQSTAPRCDIDDDGQEMRRQTSWGVWHEVERVEHNKTNERRKLWKMSRMIIDEVQWRHIDVTSMMMIKRMRRHTSWGVRHDDESNDDNTNEYIRKSSMMSKTIKSNDEWTNASLHWNIYVWTD